MRKHIGLYRGKRKHDGEWVEGFYLKKKDPILHSEMHFILRQESTAGFLSSLYEWYSVDPDTVGECCGGLADKNGELIFEGDVLRLYCEEHECEADGYAVIHYGRFKDTDAMSDFDHLGWYLTITSIPNEATTVFALEEQGLAFEIIGNIHDNPELLGGGDNE